MQNRENNRGKQEPADPGDSQSQRENLQQDQKESLQVIPCF